MSCTRRDPTLLQRPPGHLLHIGELVAEAAAERGYCRVGLTGTSSLFDGPVYPDRLAAHGIECLHPQTSDWYELNRIVMDELVPGVIRAESVAGCAG